MAAVLAADPGAPPQRPPAVRVPTGPLADAFEVTTGRQAWDAGLVRAPTLIVFSEKDFWSRAEDRDRLQAHLVNAGEVKVVTLPGATHYAHLDRAGARASGADRCAEDVLTQERTSSGASTGGMIVR